MSEYDFSSSSSFSTDHESGGEKSAEDMSLKFNGDFVTPLTTDQHHIQLNEQMDVNGKSAGVESTSSLPGQVPLLSPPLQQEKQLEEQVQPPPPLSPTFLSTRPSFSKEFLLQQLEITEGDVKGLNFDAIINILNYPFTVVADTGSVLGFLIQSENSPAQTSLCALALAIYGVHSNLYYLQDVRKSIGIDIQVNKALFHKVVDCAELLHVAQRLSRKFLLSSTFVSHASENLKNSIPEHVLEAVLCQLPTQVKVVQHFKADTLKSATNLLFSEFCQNQSTAKSLAIRYTTAFQRWFNSFGRSFMSVLLEENCKWGIGTGLVKVVYDSGESSTILNLHKEMLVMNGIDIYNDDVAEGNLGEWNLDACKWSTVIQIVTALYDCLWNIHLSTPYLTITLMKGLESIGARNTIKAIIANLSKFEFSSQKDKILIKATFGDVETINELATCIATKQRNTEEYRREHIFELDEKTFGKLLGSPFLQISSIEKYKLIVEWACNQGGQVVLDPLAIVGSDKSQLEFKKQYHHVDFNGLLQYAYMIYFQRFIDPNDITKCT